jgi:hypothetical protein
MGKRTLLAIAAVVAASGALMSAPAQARGSVVLSLGVPAPVYGYGYGQPVYSQPVYPQAVYPQPVYTQPYAYAQPGYVVAEPNIYIGSSYGYGYGYGHRNGWRDGDHRRFNHR